MLNNTPLDQEAKTLASKIAADLARLRMICVDPVSIAVSDVIDIELRPASEGHRVLIGRSGWGHTVVKYTAEGLVLDVFGEDAISPLHTANVGEDELSITQEACTDVPALPEKLEWATVGETAEIGLSLKHYFVTNPLMDVGLIDKVDPMECWGLTLSQANFIVGLNEQLQEAVEGALNVACARLQRYTGISDGGFAGMYFSDPDIRNQLAEIFAAYIVADFNGNES